MPCWCCCIPPVSSFSSISPASPEIHANKQTKKSSVFCSASLPNPNFGAHTKDVGVAPGLNSGPSLRWPGLNLGPSYKWGQVLFSGPSNQNEWVFQVRFC
jgi:hypothetical protein